MIQKIAALLFVCLLTPALAFAQNYPEPASAGEPAVLCTGCPGGNAANESNNGKPLYPYNVPLADHVGRVVDSSTTANVQNLGMRTLRAEKVRIRPSHDRIYVQLGSTIAAYTLSTFFTSTLPKPMVGVNTLHTGGPYAIDRYGKPFERLARPDAFIYAESNVSGWTFGLQDSQLQLADFDSDDRGYVYLSTISFGWGIHFDDARTDGKHLPFIKQDADNLDMDRLFSVRNGDQYFVVGGDADALWVYDVTNPSSPTMADHRTGTGIGIVNWAKLEGGDRVAIVDGDRTFAGTTSTLRIYTTSALIAGGAAIAEYVLPSGRGFGDFSFDADGNLWVLERVVTGGSGWIWKLAPVGGATPSYEKTVYDAGLSPSTIHASAGYLAVVGIGTEPTDPVNTSELHLYKLVDGTPQAVNTDSFFRKHYHRAPAGFAQPNGGSPAWVTGRNVHLVAHNGLTYLIYNALGLGDVYELGDVLRAPQLKVNSISPTTGLPAGGTVVTITGRNFGQDSAVKFGNTIASTTFVDSFKLTAVAPKGTGNVDVSVASAGQFATAPMQFSYVLPPPSNLVAKATSTTAVTMNWTGSAGATKYEIWRYSGSSFVAIGTVTGLTFTESGLTPGNAYVYRVHAMDADDNRSAPSLRDIATTMQFTDATITPGLRIKAAHLLELRQAVNLVRAAAGMSPATFTGTIGPGAVVKAVHVSELRNAVQPAANFFGVVSPFTDANLPGVLIKAVHLQELRNIVQ